MLSHQDVTVEYIHMFEDDEYAGFAAEQRLWCAVVISAIEEYREWLQRIYSGWTATQRPVQASFKFSLKHIRQQCETEWFTMICEMADIAPERIFKKFDQMDKEYCLNQIPFQNEPERFMSQWALRKSAKLRIV